MQNGLGRFGGPSLRNSNWHVDCLRRTGAVLDGLLNATDYGGVKAQTGAKLASCKHIYIYTHYIRGQKAVNSIWGIVQTQYLPPINGTFINGRNIKIPEIIREVSLWLSTLWAFAWGTVVSPPRPPLLVGLYSLYNDKYFLQHSIIL